jgi:hypothetical protein
MYTEFLERQPGVDNLLSSFLGEFLVAATVSQLGVPVVILVFGPVVPRGRDRIVAHMDRGGYHRAMQQSFDLAAYYTGTVHVLYVIDIVQSGPRIIG